MLACLQSISLKKKSWTCTRTEMSDTWVTIRVVTEGVETVACSSYIWTWANNHLKAGGLILKRSCHRCSKTHVQLQCDVFSFPPSFLSSFHIPEVYLNMHMCLNVRRHTCVRRCMCMEEPKPDIGLFSTLFIAARFFGWAESLGILLV